MTKMGSLGTCKITHTISIPSRLSDYDYDPTNPNRRFLSTYMHNVLFSDPITGVDLVSISFDSMTCAEIISALYKIAFQNSINVNPIIIENIYHSNVSIPGIIILSKCNGIIKFGICDFVSPAVTFDITNTKLLIDIFDIDEMEKMFISE